jgi:hypothetical protein
MGDRRCCRECEIAKDSLAGDPLSDTWTLKAGSWNDTAVVDGYTETTGIVELWHVTPHPDDTNGYPSDVRLRIRGAADSKVRLILSASGTVAGGDALIVELEPGTDCGTLRLYQRTDGVEDLLGTLSVYGAVVDEWHDMRGCYDPETEVFTGSILPHHGTYWSQLSADVEAHADGAYAGFASGTADASDFDTFVYSKLWYDEVIVPLCSVVTVENYPQPISVLGWIPVTGDTTSITFVFDGIKTFTANYFSGATSTIYAADIAADFDPWLAANFSNVSVTIVGDSDTSLTFTFTDPDDEYTCIHVVVQREDPKPVMVSIDKYFRDGQTITVTTEGQHLFRLACGTETTGNLSTDSTAAEIQSALESLTDIGAGIIDAGGSDGGPWNVEPIVSDSRACICNLVPVVDINDCSPNEATTIRHVCSSCEFCCIFSPPYSDGCDVTVLSGEWENATVSPVTGEFYEEATCETRGTWGDFYHSTASGSFRVDSTLPSATPWRVSVTATCVLAPATDVVIQLDFSNGDYLIATWSQTANTLTLDLNGTDTFTSGVTTPDANDFWIFLEFCRTGETTCRVSGFISDHTGIPAVEAGGVVIDLTSDYDETTVTTTTSQETYLRVDAVYQHAKCTHCAGCTCRPYITETLTLDFGTSALTDGCPDGDVCADFPRTVELIRGVYPITGDGTPPYSQYDLLSLGHYYYVTIGENPDCGFSGSVLAWWSSKQEQFTRMLLHVPTNTKYYETSPPGPRYTTMNDAVQNWNLWFATVLASGGSNNVNIRAWVISVPLTGNEGDFLYTRECDGTLIDAPYYNSWPSDCLTVAQAHTDYGTPDPLPGPLDDWRWYYMGDDQVVKLRPNLFAMYKATADCEDLSEPVELSLCEYSDDNPDCYCNVEDVGGSTLEAHYSPELEAICVGDFPATIMCDFNP